MALEYTDTGYWRSIAHRIQRARDHRQTAVQNHELHRARAKGYTQDIATWKPSITAVVPVDKTLYWEKSRARN